MSLEAIYSIVYLLGGLAELLLLAVLLVRRQYRVFPVFTTYIAFNILSDLLVAVLSAKSTGNAASWVALFLLPPQYLLELAVLLEIAWRLLKPVHSSIPPGAIKVFLWLVFLALLGGVLLAGHVNPQHGSGIYEKLKFPLDLTVGLLRMILFAATAAFAQMLGIGWKDRVLQLATGLSFYSAVDLVASLVQSHHGLSATADHLKGAAYLVEIGFFIWAFTTKEAERREFSPQMQEFLLTIAGRARDARSAVRSQVK
ncbi:MAG TPA: hypothetical protein VGR96_20050 [Acidobacteriaceae bacterium]|nr:hypothetical protein [Acidobacteriaceae bacterium]